MFAQSYYGSFTASVHLQSYANYSFFLYPATASITGANIETAITNLLNYAKDRDGEGRNRQSEGGKGETGLSVWI